MAASPGLRRRGCAAYANRAPVATTSACGPVCVRATSAWGHGAPSSQTVLVCVSGFLSSAISMRAKAKSLWLSRLSNFRALELYYPLVGVRTLRENTKNER